MSLSQPNGESRGRIAVAGRCHFLFVGNKRGSCCRNLPSSHFLAWLVVSSSESLCLFICTLPQGKGTMASYHRRSGYLFPGELLHNSMSQHHTEEEGLHCDVFAKDTFRGLLSTGELSDVGGDRSFPLCYF